MAAKKKGKIKTGGVIFGSSPNAPIQYHDNSPAARGLRTKAAKAGIEPKAQKLGSQTVRAAKAVSSTKMHGQGSYKQHVKNRIAFEDKHKALGKELIKGKQVSAIAPKAHYDAKGDIKPKKAQAAQPRALQRGKKGGTFYISNGRKVYTKK